MGGRQSMPTPALLARPGGWALVIHGGWPVCWKVNPGTCTGWMLFYRQKCCSQRLVHCNSSSSGPPLLPGVLGLSRSVCRSPHGGSKHGVPQEHGGISACLGKRLGAEKVPVNPHFAASAISCPLLGYRHGSKSLVSWRALRDCRLLCGGQDTVQLEGRKL